MTDKLNKFKFFINAAICGALFGAIHAHYYTLWIQKQTIKLAGIIK